MPKKVFLTGRSQNLKSRLVELGIPADSIFTQDKNTVGDELATIGEDPLEKEADYIVYCLSKTDFVHADENNFYLLAQAMISLCSNPKCTIIIFATYGLYYTGKPMQHAVKTYKMLKEKFPEAPIFLDKGLYYFDEARDWLVANLTKE